MAGRLGGTKGGGGGEHGTALGLSTGAIQLVVAKSISLEFIPMSRNTCRGLKKPFSLFETI